MKNIQLKGILAAPGMAEGLAVWLHSESPAVPRYVISNPEGEMERLQAALDQADQEILQLKKKLEEVGAASEAGVFDAHSMFLKDPSLLEISAEAIRSGLNAEAAWMDGVSYFAQAISALSDETLAARGGDVRDVGQRVLRKLLGLPDEHLQGLAEPSIILARDLTPSQTAGLDKTMIAGFCTVEGGPTSHTAILSKALGIPALVGLGEALQQVEPGAYLLLDANAGVLTVNADPAAQESFRERSGQSAATRDLELALANQPAVTLDGHSVEVVANVGSLADAQSALVYGAEGIGLLRTEFLYLDRSTAPSEDEQVEIYRAIFEVMGTRPVVVRTLDIGGDKEIPYLEIRREANPFLGWRAIRICIDQPEMLKTQIRALLRASPGHDVRIMFPMVSTLREVRLARQIFDQSCLELSARGQPVGGHIQIGIMVEIPSVAILAEKFAELVDFFSIGTNDLTQYTFAADRGNERVAHLGDPCHPAVLRQIARVIEAGHARSIWVGLCGEMGGDPEGIPILLGLGLDEFSISSSAIPHAKAILRSWSVSKAQLVAQAALDAEDAEAVRSLVRAQSR